MKNPNKKNIKEEKKIYPFLFLVFLFGVGLAGTHFWNMWGEQVAKQELKDVIRSDDIEILLSGATFSKDTTLADLSKQLKQNPDILSIEQLLQKQKKENTSDNTNIPTHNSSPNTLANASPDALADSQDIVNLALRNIIISQGENGVENWRLSAEWATLRQTSSVLNLNKPYLVYRTGNKNILSDSNNKQKKITETEQTIIVKNSETDIAQNIDTNNTNNTNNTNKTNIKPFKITGLQQNTKKVTDSLQNDFMSNSKNILLITAKNGLIFNHNTKINLTEDVFAKQEKNYVKGDTLNYDDTTRIATFPHSATFAGENIKGNALVLDWDLNKNQLIGTGKVEVTWHPEKKRKP